MRQRRSPLFGHAPGVTAPWGGRAALLLLEPLATAPWPSGDGPGVTSPLPSAVVLPAAPDAEPPTVQEQAAQGAPGRPRRAQAS